MKKTIIVTLFSLFFSFSVFAAENKNILIAYFSKTGTTEAIAKQIQTGTGGDLFKIDVVNPYPNEYRATTEQAKKELEEGIYPSLKGKVQNLNKYDTIFLGYPIWWGTMPMPVFTFLNENNLNGKKIIPFTTHQGSGLGRSVEDLIKVVPDGEIEKNGIAVRGRTSQKNINEWIKEVLD